ncbi:MAG TPA: histidine--tRNA ligase [Verrucomicrobiota bacterium]|nr:histidine--tRNA ligase [Verrucomicrobiota bacterium]HNU50778.1 histidine--tRNA ligase [Verrucomicrobiota bacterium]
MDSSEEKRKRLVAPQTLKGFRDLMPVAMIARNAVIEKIRSVYEKYGFVPIDTPVLEHLGTLLGPGGEEINKELFRLESPEREPIAMRFDLTVPYARLLAQYPDQLKLPFRRYHVGPVFRADKPGPGRFRQFVQFDIDAAGSESVAVDAEIVAAMAEVMRALGLGNGEFQIRINNRRLVDALLLCQGIADGETQKHVLRVIDKLPKVGAESVRKELGDGRVDDSGDPIPGVGLSGGVIEDLIQFISIQGTSRKEVLDGLARVLPQGATRDAALGEMSELNEALASLRVAEHEAVFDPSLMRGLDYYTGPVFEAHLPGAPHFGSVMGGGRYDQLVARFMDQSVPATGASIGLDRLMDALAHLGRIRTAPTTTKVMVLSLRGVPSRELLSIAHDLRDQGIPTEVFFAGSNAGFRDQLSAANARQVPIAVILGEDELKTGRVSIKDLRVGMQARAAIQSHEEYKKSGRTGQVTVARNELVQTVTHLLSGQ